MPINQVVLTYRQVRWSQPVAACEHCSQVARRVWDTSRVAIDIDLDRPVLLQVIVSVHFCPPCRHYFRLQPPFLRPDATYTRRVVERAVDSVYRDGLPFSRVAQRLARDFWVRPSERMVRLWCRDYARALPFEQDYQPWVVAEFSGILCVDEVYQNQLALLLAVDPAAPSGDRLVGYQLVHGDVKESDVESFLQRLSQAGIKPDEVITDGSPLYPKVLRQVWPEALHQLCLFHESRRVVSAVQQVIQEVQAGLPKAPVAQRPMGRFRKEPPATAGPDQLQYDRKTRLALVWQLRRQGYSQRAIARRTGHSRRTIERWLKEPPSTPEAGPDGEAAGSALVQESSGEVPFAASDEVAQVIEPDWRERPAEPPPPEPWRSWDEVRAYRQALQTDRFLLLRRPDHLSEEDQVKLGTLLSGPTSEQLGVARRFLVEWYRIPWTEGRQRRTLEEAQERWRTWRANPEYRGLIPLRRLLDRMGEEKAARVLAFLQDERWEATNNGAERGARQFRHLQASCFRLRTGEAMEGVLKATAWHVKEALTKPKREVARSTRGRHPREGAAQPVAA